MFFFAESDEQRVSAMVSLAKVSVAFMQVMSDMSETECNGQLKLQKTLLEVAFDWMFPQGLPMFTRQALHDFPLMTAKLLKVLKLQPKLTRYAACPKCYKLYPANQSGVYPSFCIYQWFPDSQSCSTPLLDIRTKQPLRPHLYHRFQDWLQGLLSTPGMYTKLAKPPSISVNGILRDLWDGSELQDLDRLFHAAKDGLRLVFSIGVDWYNPFGNKIAGLVASLGVVALVCMNLPPSERYRPENMYLVTILPGPRESTQEQFNNLIDPLIDDFRDIWEEHGIQYPGTADTPTTPCDVSAAIVPLVADLLASRKAVGAKPAATRKKGFCAMGVHTENEEDHDDAPPKRWGLSAQEWRY